MKSGTTVAMDFGRITLGDDMWVQIYGTPGQKRFDFMWELLIEGAHGYVLLVPAHMPSSIQEAKKIHSFMQQKSDIPFIIGITHGDHEDAWELEDIQAALDDSEAKNTYVPVNATQKQDVAQVLLALVQNLFQEMQLDAA